MVLCLLTHLIFGAGIVLAQPSILQDISHLESSKSPLLQYPTQLTQNIDPKAIHSHNDCEFNHDFLKLGAFRSLCQDWRDVPLLTAVSLGVGSVEADVWLVDEQLFVSQCGSKFLSEN
jgi:hypothetical protein